MRTSHDLRPHEAPVRIDSLLLRGPRHAAARWIPLNDVYAPPPGAPVTTLPLGHYRESYSEPPG